MLLSKFHLPRLSSFLQTQSGTFKYMYVSIPNRMSCYVNGNVNRTGLSFSLFLCLTSFSVSPFFYLSLTNSCEFQHARGKTRWRTRQNTNSPPPRNRGWFSQTFSAVLYRLFLKWVPRAHSHTYAHVQHVTSYPLWSIVIALFFSAPSPPPSPPSPLGDMHKQLNIERALRPPTDPPLVSGD